MLFYIDSSKSDVSARGNFEPGGIIENADSGGRSQLVITGTRNALDDEPMPFHNPTGVLFVKIREKGERTEIAQHESYYWGYDRIDIRTFLYPGPDMWRPMGGFWVLTLNNSVPRDFQIEILCTGQFKWGNAYVVMEYYNEPRVGGCVITNETGTGNLHIKASVSTR